MGSDREIWDDFRKGEKYALSHIYHRHVNLLFRYGRKFTNDSDIIQDSIQDLFFDLIRTRKNLGPTDNIRFYLMRSFRRKLVQNFEKVQPSEQVFKYESEPSVVFSFEEELIGRESQSDRDRLINKCLQELNPRQREILFYRYTCDLGYDEICELMSLKYDSARKLVHRALESLKKLFSDQNIVQLFFLFVRKI